MGISSAVKKRLWIDSAGYCQNPTCNSELYSDPSQQYLNIEEIAHIIARTKDGPRGISELDETERNQYDNLIILCPNCHTKIDKNPETFPPEMLISWKLTHKDRIRSIFQIPTYNTKGDLRKALVPLLKRNKQIFITYGPHSPSSNDPLSDASLLWEKYILEEIIPNNRRISALLLKNCSLLSDKENSIIQQFIIHQEGFEYNHISGEKNSSVPLFPVEMEDISEEKDARDW